MYHYHDHHGEVAIHASGDSPHDALSELSKGLFSVMTDIRTVRCVEQVSFHCKARSYPYAIIETLNELLYLMNVNEAFYSSFEYHIEQEGEHIIIHGIACGERITNHPTYTEVKAATYSGLQVNDDRTDITIVVDV